PPDYNGFKMVLDGETLYGTMIQALRKTIEAERFTAGRGILRHADVKAAYIDRIVADVKLARPMKLVVDCGNGVAGAFAPDLFRRMGCEVIELFCEVDGNFPNHHPDPSKPANLRDVQRVLRETDAELGLAFDGDGDRLGVVTKDGEIIYPDRQLMLFAADVLTRNPGAQIIHDVKCSRWVAESVRFQGGVPVMWNTGHALIKAKLRETGAPLAGEMSGHMFFKERWYGFDDGLYAGARLLEIVSRWPDASWPLKHLPNAISTPELNLKMQEGEPHRLIAKLQKAGRFPTARELITLDGVRAEYPDGFGLARASNTTPVIVLRFEADTAQALERIQAEFKAALQAVWPGLDVDYEDAH
ncbi:MAG: phosphomannomutase/phosphoglucomutase, partial [Rhodocyclaceae bacterium]|nr:phosphomannomutase/phosphoglucomutase [Rhodocyclaceae bacterium]